MRIHEIYIGSEDNRVSRQYAEHFFGKKKLESILEQFDSYGVNEGNMIVGDAFVRIVAKEF